MSVITEVISMKIAKNIDKEDFIKIVNGLEQNYHSKQVGFIDTELLFDSETDTWAMIQHWNNLENLSSASNKMFSDIAAEAFVKSLIPESVSKSTYSQIQRW